MKKSATTSMDTTDVQNSISIIDHELQKLENELAMFSSDKLPELDVDGGQRETFALTSTPQKGHKTATNVFDLLSDESELDQPLTWMAESGGDQTNGSISVLDETKEDDLKLFQDSIDLDASANGSKGICEEMDRVHSTTPTSSKFTGE